MVADGKLNILDKMVVSCYDEYARKNFKTEWKPVLLFINEAKFYKDVDINDIVTKPRFISFILQKVALYECKVYVGDELVAESKIGFGEE